MGSRRSGAAPAGDQRTPDAHRYVVRRHLGATVRAGAIVAAAVEFILGSAAYISGRAATSLGVPLPVVSPLVPLTIAAGLGLVALVVFGIGLRPRRVAASHSTGGREAPRGGTRWPGAAAVGLDGAAGHPAVTR